MVLYQFSEGWNDIRGMSGGGGRWGLMATMFVCLEEGRVWFELEIFGVGWNMEWKWKWEINMKLQLGAKFTNYI